MGIKESFLVMKQNTTSLAMMDPLNEKQPGDVLLNEYKQHRLHK
jgi:hypothetical protein